MKTFCQLFAVLLIVTAVAQAAGADNQSASVAAPKIEILARQNYVAIQEKVSVGELGKVIPVDIGRVSGWLKTHNLAPSGPPFVRYVVIDMPSRLIVQIGFPVIKSPKLDAPLRLVALPAGHYISYVYTGSPDGLVGATSFVLGWAQSNKISLDSKTTKQGTIWGGRAEIYLTDPSIEPNPKNWRTDIIIRTNG
jgi:effector-binding domain-containing protein